MLKDKIYNHFKSQEKNGVSDEYTVAPSYFSDCQRKIYYKKTGEPASNPIDEASYFKMALGSAGHDKIQSIIKDLPDVNLVECEDLKDIEWSGLKWYYRLDGLIEINNEKYIMEIKTIYGAGFRFIEKDGPKEEHLLQMYLYMIFEKIEKGIILYVGRDNGFMLEFTYTIADLNKIFKDRTEAKIKDLKKLKIMVESKNIPDRDYQIVLKNCGDHISEDFTKDKVKQKTAWQCSYCQWKYTCHKETYDNIKDHKFFIDNKFID